MSINHCIKTNGALDFNLLQTSIERSLEGVRYVQRSETLCYFWLHGRSTRGVDVSVERENWIEIRTTSFSNAADYHLTNELVGSICQLSNGELYKENEDYDEDDADTQEYIITYLPVFPREEWEKLLVQDTASLRIVITQLEETITLFGPIRKTHFGLHIIKSFQEKTDQQLAGLLEKICLNVNYNWPDYDYGNVMEVGEGFETKIVKLLTNEANCIIDKYDYLLLTKSENELIALTNDDLNNILPESWQRVDEYTIVAPILADSAFLHLIAAAEKYNKIKEMVQ